MPFRPKYPFNAVSDDGTSKVIGPDQLYADDHPFVAKYPELMVDIEPFIVQNPRRSRTVVEQATAAPGEVRRGPGRPRKQISDL